MRIEIDKNSWRTGYNDGYNQKTHSCPSNLDSYSYSSGYIEGKADQGKDNK